MKILNYINGEWIKPSVPDYIKVINPATGELLAQTPICGSEDVDKAVEAASTALPSWRHVPAQERIQYLFKLRDLLKLNLDDISRDASRPNVTLGVSLHQDQMLP